MILKIGFAIIAGIIAGTFTTKFYIWLVKYAAEKSIKESYRRKNAKLLKDIEADVMEMQEKLDFKGAEK